MGIEDRDYYRRWHGRPADGGASGEGGRTRPDPNPGRRRRPEGNAGPGGRPEPSAGQRRHPEGSAGSGRRPEPSDDRAWLRRIRLAIVVAIITVTIYALIEFGVFDSLDRESTPVVTEEQQDAEQGEAQDSGAGEAGASPPQDEREAPMAEHRPPAECPVPSELADGASTAEPTLYVVEAGDTMSAISRRLGISIHELIALNPDADPDVIHVGDLLRVRSGSERVLPARPGAGIAPDDMYGLQWLALFLVNEAREESGLMPVALGANPAPQEHAEDMAESCFLSHWGTDGMKPYMRYSQAGGVQANSENVSGSSFCPADPSRYVQQSLAAELREAFEGLMGSSGHRANILRPEHRVLHLGMAYRAPNFWLVQQFSGHYAAFAQVPRIEEGELSFDMSACNGARVSGDALAVQVRHDPPPSPLMPGQLQRTSCYSSGRAIAALRPPLPPGSNYTEDEFRLQVSDCPDPHALSPNLPPAQSYEEASSFKDDAGQTQSASTRTGVWITAEHWDVGSNRARVAADLSDLLRSAGGGVYTVFVWGAVNGVRTPIAEYSIFVE